MEFYYLFLIALKLLQTINTCQTIPNMCKKGNILSNYSCTGNCDHHRVTTLGESRDKDFVCEHECLKIDLDENASLLNCKGYHPHEYCPELNMYTSETENASYYEYITKLVSIQLDYIKNETGPFKQVDIRLGFSKWPKNSSFIYSSSNFSKELNLTNKMLINCDFECGLQIIQYPNKSILSQIIEYPYIDETRNQTNTLCVKKKLSTSSMLKTSTAAFQSTRIKEKVHFLCPSDDPIHISREMSKIENKRIADINSIKENTKNRIELIKSNHKLSEFGRKGFGIIAIAYLASIIGSIIFMDFPKLISLIKNFKNN